MVLMWCLDKINSLRERHLPWVSGIMTMLIVVCVYRGTVLEITDAISRLLDAVITFTSVSVGFVGVLLGILFSVRDAPLIATLLGGDEPKKLTYGYFREAIVSGFVVIVLSAVLHLLNPGNAIIVKWQLRLPPTTIILAIWAGLAIYAFFASYRIMVLMMKALFRTGEQSQTQKQGPKMEDNARMDLEHKLRRK